MRWVKISKDPNFRPPAGTYKTWKRALSVEGKQQCCYCAIHESRFGGFRNFHVEHYRPKSIFKTLVDDYGNLLYVCAVCNSFKGNSWPSDENPAIAVAPNDTGYLSPILFDYNMVIEVDGAFHVTSESKAAQYMIERVFLNRPQLVLMRRLASTQAKVLQAVDLITKLADEDGISGELYKRIVKLNAAATHAMNDLLMAIPYQPDDLER